MNIETFNIALVVAILALTAIQVYRTFTGSPSQMFHWPDARGWIGIGVWVMSVGLLWMMYLDKSFREDEFVQTIATLVIGTGFVGGAVSWAYAATKGGGEAAASSARIAEAQAGIPVVPLGAPPPTPGPTGTAEDPVHARIDNPENEPVPTTPGDPGR